MESGKNKSEVKPPYVKPEVLASYQKHELEEIIMPHVEVINGGCGCGCGCG
jgi:hypothetical protein